MMYWVTERLDFFFPPDAWDGDVGSGKPPALPPALDVLGCDWVPWTLRGRGGVPSRATRLEFSHPFRSSPPASLLLDGLRIKHNAALPPTHPQKLFSLVSEIGKLRYCWH